MMIFRIACLALVGCCLTTGAMAQKKQKETKEEEEIFVFSKTELMGGPSADWDGYMRASAVLPDSVKRRIPPGTYKVLISFVVNTDGALQHIAVEQDPGYGLGLRALDIFKNYKGKWRPAMQCGRAVKNYKKEPVVFVIAG